MEGSLAHRVFTPDAISNSHRRHCPYSERPARAEPASFLPSPLHQARWSTLWTSPTCFATGKGA
eukprot:scaffold39632_cov29-Tisochrysis_lutea.AAC.3